MKVLFVGEGAHDIGHTGVDPFQPQPAGGVVPVLARKVCPLIGTESLALRWVEIARFDPIARKRGFQAKVAAAVLLAARRFDCAGVICVADCDGDPSRLAEMEEGRKRGLELLGETFPVVCGLAVDSIEAWTLGAMDAVAEELALEVAAVRGEYPKSDVESLSERSGKVEHHPKALLERIAQLQHRSDCTELREAIAARTSVEALERTCPQGFKPFAEAVRAEFGSTS